MTKTRSVCVFCGSRVGDDPIFKQTAARLGEIFAAKNVRLVYGGGKLGLMGVTASAVRDAGGNVFGVIPKFLVDVEGVLDGVEHLQVETMHERKMRMFEEADGFCVLPGGIGTLEEIIELLSWARLELHRKPLIILNVEGFWTPLLELIDHVVERGFADPALKQDITVVEREEDVLPAIEAHQLRNLV